VRCTRPVPPVLTSEVLDLVAKGLRLLPRPLHLVLPLLQALLLVPSLDVLSEEGPVRFAGLWESLHDEAGLWPEVHRALTGLTMVCGLD
jgi:hypothetical protein